MRDLPSDVRSELVVCKFVCTVVDSAREEEEMILAPASALQQVFSELERCAGPKQKG